jgi:hypothetical protein
MLSACSKAVRSDCVIGRNGRGGCFSVGSDHVVEGGKSFVDIRWFEKRGDEKYYGYRALSKRSNLKYFGSFSLFNSSGGKISTLIRSLSELN